MRRVAVLGSTGSIGTQALQRCRSMQYGLPRAVLHSPLLVQPRHCVVVPSQMGEVGEWQSWRRFAQRKLAVGPELLPRQIDQRRQFEEPLDV